MLGWKYNTIDQDYEVTRTIKNLFVKIRWINENVILEGNSTTGVYDDDGIDDVSQVLTMSADGKVSIKALYSNFTPISEISIL